MDWRRQTVLMCFPEARKPTAWELRIADFGAHIAHLVIERRRSGEALAEKSRELARILDVAATGLARCSRDRRYLSVNRAYAEISGRRVDEMVGQRVDDVESAETIALLDPHIEKVLSGAVTEFDVETFGSDGTDKIVHTIYVPDFSDTGDVSGWVASATDITSGRHIERALAARDALLRGIAERAQVGVYMLDKSWRYTYANPAYLETMGLEPRDITGLDACAVIGQERFDEVKSAHERAMAGETVLIERHGSVVGSTRPFAEWRLVSLQPFANDGGDITGIIGIVLDITERKRAEQRQALLIRELAHRGKNLLAVIRSIATRTFRDGADILTAREAFIGRLLALSRTYSVLTVGEFEGAAMKELVKNELGPFADRLTVEGFDLVLNDKAAQTMALMLHELASNAVTHGAWSSPGGSVSVSWRLIEDKVLPRIRFIWRERGVVPVREAARAGFGSTLILKVIASEFSTTPEFNLTDEGLDYSFTAPLEALTLRPMPDRSMRATLAQLEGDYGD